MISVIDQLLLDIKKIQECGCAGVGVTTGSFAHAVTNTVYPKPNKTKKEDSDDDSEEDSSDVYYSTKKAWADFNKSQQPAFQKAHEEAQKKQNSFLDKYRIYINLKRNEINNIYDNYKNDPEIDNVQLINWYNDRLNEISKAENNLASLSKFAPEAFCKIEKPQKRKINSKFDRWRFLKYRPELD